MIMPLDFAEQILEHMVKSELLCRTTEPGVGYVPSTDGTHITLDEISRAISEISFAQADTTGPTRMFEVFEQMRGHLSKFTLKEVLNKAWNGSQALNINNLEEGVYYVRIFDGENLYYSTTIVKRD